MTEPHAGLVRALDAICRDVLAIDTAAADQIAAAAPASRSSARNLVHYLGLRRHDIRVLQDQLAGLGLSSLGRAEGHVLTNLDAVIGHLRRMLRTDAEPAADGPFSTPGPSAAEGQALLDAHTVGLLGPEPAGRHVRIMVTMPAEAADSPTLIRDLVRDGMDCVRINCAHDGPEGWAKMISRVRDAEAEAGRRCRVLMDLGGPKLRTGPLPPGPKMVKVRPERDDLGQVTEPARLWLTADPATAPVAHVPVPVPRDWLARLRPRDRVKLKDARGSERQLKVVSVAAGGATADLDQTAYLVTGTRLRIRGKCCPDLTRGQRTTHVGDLPERPTRIHLRIGDTLLLTRDPDSGAPANGSIPARIGCTLPEVFADVRAGETIWLDDGKIGGVIRAAAADRLTVEITQAATGGNWLAADKGINLPDTDLTLPALTATDVEDLKFVAAHADLVGYSFVKSADDVEALRRELGRLNRPDLGVILKIETRRAFDRLPEILLAAMRGPIVGVMIARGDLAVETGFERLAEVQEEILWLCEAAHVPVVWATQVLENLAKEGRPSRAEITDAAMGERAECVMLNKGPHVREAVRLLDGILRRMEAHQSKKRSRLRPLRVARLFPESNRHDRGDGARRTNRD
jgi:pyruvate kinase